MTHNHTSLYPTTPLQERYRTRSHFPWCMQRYLAVPELNIRFIDSLCFIPLCLANFPKTFGIIELEKGFFPHFFNYTDNQRYVEHLLWHESWRKLSCRNPSFLPVRCRYSPPLCLEFRELFRQTDVEFLLG